MTNNMVDFDAVNSRAMGWLESLLHEWLPNGKKIGNEYICGDWDGRAGESLSINIRTGKGADFAGDDRVGDPIGIDAKIVTNGDRVEAARALAGIFGMEGG